MIHPERRVTSYISQQSQDAYAKLLVMKKVLQGALFLFVPDLKLHDLDEMPKDKEYVTETRSKDEKQTYTTKFYHSSEPQALEADRARLIVPAGWLCRVQRASLDDRRQEQRLTADGIVNVENGAAGFHIGRVFLPLGRASVEPLVGAPEVSLRVSTDLTGLESLLQGYTASRDDSVTESVQLSQNLTADGIPWRQTSLN